MWDRHPCIAWQCYEDSFLFSQSIGQVSYFLPAAGLPPLQPPFAGLTLPTAVLSPTLGQQVRFISSCGPPQYVRSLKSYLLSLQCNRETASLQLISATDQGLKQLAALNSHGLVRFALSCSSTPYSYRPIVSWVQIQSTSSLLVVLSPPFPTEIFTCLRCGIFKLANRLTLVSRPALSYHLSEGFTKPIS